MDTIIAKMLLTHMRTQEMQVRRSPFNRVGPSSFVMHGVVAIDDNGTQHVKESETHPTTPMGASRCGRAIARGSRVARHTPNSSSFQGRSTKQPIARLDVLRSGILDDFTRELGARRLLVPPPRGDQFLQVVPQILLVEALLVPARLIAIGRPEA